MKQILPAYTLLAIIIQLITSCTSGEKESSSVTITVKTTAPPTTGAKIFYYTSFSFEQVTLAEGTFDSTGTAVLTFDLPKAEFALVEAGGKIAPMYLAPGYTITASLDTHADQPFRYSGEGAAVSNQLVNVLSVQSKINSAGGQHILDLAPEAFLARFDSLKKSTDAFYEHAADSVPENVRSLLKAKIDLNLLITKLDYVFIHWRDSLPTSFKNIVDDIQLDPALLNNRLIEYSIVLDKYLQIKFFFPSWEGKSPAEIEASKDHLTVAIDSALRKGDYPSPIRELLLARNINYWLVNEGITVPVDSIYASFRKDYSASPYRTPLEDTYQKWSALLPGKPAPDFAGITFDGKSFSLHDLKGKIVYIDVWATWCGPCRSEFPYSKKIQQTFQDNDQVVFLYVSIDQDKEAWKKMVSEDKEFKGIHVNHNPEDPKQSMLTAYMVSGIPHYVLIDREGKIAQSKASRPSSGKVQDEIRALLGTTNSSPL